jgi:hypothetical protein
MLRPMASAANFSRTCAAAPGAVSIRGMPRHRKGECGTSKLAQSEAERFYQALAIDGFPDLAPCFMAFCRHQHLPSQARLHRRKKWSTRATSVSAVDAPDRAAPRLRAGTGKDAVLNELKRSSPPKRHRTRSRASTCQVRVCGT